MTQVELDPTLEFSPPDGVTLNREEIQGDILRAYGNHYDCTTYVFVKLASQRAGREWLSELAGQISDDAPWTGDAKPPHHLNVAFTASGLKKLGVPEEVLDSFSPEFKLGMAARADRLGDRGDSDPKHWVKGLGTGAAHVLVTVNALDPEPLEEAMARLKPLIAKHGHTIVHERAAHLLKDAREHFGFGDGFAQPSIRGATEDRAKGGGVPLPDGKWRPLEPGEFILGYPDEDTVLDEQRRLPAAPIGPLGVNSTYMVWRQLHQDVARFRRATKAAAKHYEGGDERKLRAKIVGRWDDGSPLITHPDAPASDTPGADPLTNDFGYHAEDPEGARCPIGAHVRRSNPRDSLGWEGRLTFRHRIIRRGMPYGEPLADGVLDDPESKPERGLVFVCFQANIARQFEAIQVQWLNDGNIFGLGHDADFVMGTQKPGGSMVIQGDCPFYLSGQDKFVTTRGGEYLFVPSLSGVRAIAEGKTAP